METLIITSKKDLEEIVGNVFKNILADQRKDQIERILTVNKAAKLLRCAHATLRNKINQGIVKTLPDGRIAESEINRFLSGNTLEPP
jgi:hypothetical protein